MNPVAAIERDVLAVTVPLVAGDAVISGPVNDSIAAYPAVSVATSAHAFDTSFWNLVPRTRTKISPVSFLITPNPVVAPLHELFPTLISPSRVVASDRKKSTFFNKKARSLQMEAPYLSIPSRNVKPSSYGFQERIVF